MNSECGVFCLDWVDRHRLFTTVILLRLHDSPTIRLCREVPFRRTGNGEFVSVTFCASAQVGGSPREVVLPSPQLIHCRSVQCSQLWNKNGGPGTYPAQVLTDVVNGEVVGLTAVYDKSVSVEELRSAIDKLYPNAAIHGLSDLWRVESDQLVIRLFDRKDGTKL